MVRAITCRAVQKGELAFASLVALGFHALLPTCEILSLRFCDLELIESEELYLYRLANLAYTLGLREPSPPVTKCTPQLLDALCACPRHFPGQRLWSHRAQKMREMFQSRLKFVRVHHFGYKP
jgi:hypothetical protein